MIPYVGCEHARELLEAFLDGELSVTDQVAVESHLRWCRTCTAHVDDLRLLGGTVRSVPAACPRPEDAQALASVQAGVLARVRAERDQAFRARVRATFADTRLLFPALGATLALVLCFGVTYSVQVTTSRQLSDMLVAKTRLRALDVTQPPYAVAMLESSADPGSDQNPLRLDDAFAIPQLQLPDLKMLAGIQEDEVVFAGIQEDEAVFALATVVSRKGRIENYELLRTSSDLSGRRTAASHADNVDTVLAAVRRSRFTPAQAHGGGPVAVNMVWVIAKTTAVAGRAKPVVAVVRPTPPVMAPAPAPSDLVPAEPGRSGTILDSTTA